MEEAKQLRADVRSLKERLEQSEQRCQRLEKERVESEGKKEAEIRDEVGMSLIFHALDLIRHPTVSMP